MATQSSPPPSSDDKGFLGGGVQFNAVGASIPSSASLSSDDETAAHVPPPARPADRLRSALIILALVILACALYVVSSDSLGGVTHSQGHGGISPTAHTAEPPRNF